MDSKGLKLHVTESDKMEASVLGCRVSEKAEHLPIKKRRFLFMNSTPTRNTLSSEETETVAACLQSSSKDTNPTPDVNCPPEAPSTVVNVHQSESIDSKMDIQKFVKREDISGTSAAPGTVEFNAKCVKVENIYAKETDLHISTAPFRDKSECTRTNQVTSNTLKSAALDDRLNWDLNTIMAWEEQHECDHNMNRCKEKKFEHCEQRKDENIGNKVSPVKLKSLIPKIERSELEECKPVSDGIRKLSSPVINNAHLVMVNKIKSLHNQHAESFIPEPVPSTHTLEYPVCKISAKPVNVTAAGTDFTFMPSGFGHCIDKRTSEENLVSSKIAGLQTTENDKLNLSLVTAPSLEHLDKSSFNEDDKAKVKRVITSNGIAMDSLINRGTERSQNLLVSSKIVGSGSYVNHAMTAEQTTENEKLNLSLVTVAATETVVCRSGSIFDYEDDKAKVKRVITNKGITMENPPAAVSSMNDIVCSNVEVPLQHGKSRADIASDVVSNNKEVCDDENFPSDIQAGSEVDNIDEVSFGYTDSQFEDGEFRESSIQTEDREIEHGTENMGAFENDSLKSTDVGSIKGTDEISSVLLPEKLDSSDQISGSEPNVTENCTTEVNMKDASQSDQWKMNVSGSDLLPENHSSSNVTKIKDLSGIKSSSRITEDFETKAELSRFYRRDPSTRDTFLSSSRFRLEGSSSKADDSASMSVRDSGVIRSTGRGKYTRGGGTWDRSPPFPGPSFRRCLPEDVDNLTDKVRVDPSVTRTSFRSRLMVISEEDEFRARLGLRPSGDTCNNRFVNVGRGRSGSRHNDVGPRDRYYGPPNDELSMDYSHSFPARRRCFSPTHHHSGSTSPPRSRARSRSPDRFRCRSRSPNLRSDTRMRREPNYRHGFESDHAGGYNLEQSRNNNSPPSSRFLKYKQRSLLFDRISPPSGERLGCYESLRKTKQNENYRSSRFSELHGGGIDGDVVDHGYRRGGFVRPYDMGRPVKHMQYHEEDSYGPPVYDSRDNEALEFRGRGNPKPYVNGTDSRFRDLPRRPREDRDKW